MTNIISENYLLKYFDDARTCTPTWWIQLKRKYQVPTLPDENLRTKTNFYEHSI